MESEIRRTLCLVEGESTDVIVEHFAQWRRKEPWIYGKWIFNKYTYGILCFGILLAVINSLIAYSVATNIGGFILGYFLSQFIFGWGHMTTHALYIESPVDRWEPGVFVAYLHHYCHPREIYRNWLVHRLNFLMQKKGSLVALGLVWVIPFLCFGSELLPLYCWFLFWFAAIEPVHEYYHVPEKERKAHFSLPMFYSLRLLQALGLLNEKHHHIHHSHKKTDLESVSKFYDLYWPFADTVFNIFWRFALDVRELLVEEEEPIRKALYLQGVFLVPLTFLGVSFLFDWVLV